MKEIFKCIFVILFSVLIFFGIIQFVFLIGGPNYKEGEYTMTYKVYYPNNPRTYTIKNEWPIDIRSSRGTNWVEKTVKTPIFIKAYRGDIVFETSAPIEVVSYTFKEK